LTSNVSIILLVFSINSLASFWILVFSLSISFGSVWNKSSDFKLFLSNNFIYFLNGYTLKSMPIILIKIFVIIFCPIFINILILNYTSLVIFGFIVTIVKMFIFSFNFFLFRSYIKRNFIFVKVLWLRIIVIIINFFFFFNLNYILRFE
jgi:hypothetical protein